MHFTGPKGSEMATKPEIVCILATEDMMLINGPDGSFIQVPYL